MPVYHVPVKTLSVEVFRVTARSKEEAMNRALEDRVAEDCWSMGVHDGDPEVYYPDIIEIKNT